MAIKIFGTITFLGALFFFCAAVYVILDDIINQPLEDFNSDDLNVVAIFILSFSAMAHVIIVHSGYLKLMKKRNELELAKMEQEIFNIKTGVDKQQNT